MPTRLGLLCSCRFKFWHKANQDGCIYASIKVPFSPGDNILERNCDRQLLNTDWTEMYYNLIRTTTS